MSGGFDEERRTPAERALRTGDLDGAPLIRQDLFRWAGHPVPDLVAEPVLSAEEWTALGEAMALRHPRCPRGVGRRRGHAGHHLLPAGLVEYARTLIGGAAVRCERCGAPVYVPGGGER